MRAVLMSRPKVGKCLPNSTAKGKPTVAEADNANAGGGEVKH